MLYTFHRFKQLSTERQLEQLTLHGLSLDLSSFTPGGEAVLFAYMDFYVELVVEKFTDEILAIHCFRNTQKLLPYLQQVDISEITALLTCSK